MTTLVRGCTVLHDPLTVSELRVVTDGRTHSEPVMSVLPHQSIRFTASDSKGRLTLEAGFQQKRRVCLRRKLYPTHGQLRSLLVELQNPAA